MMSRNANEYSDVNRNGSPPKELPTLNAVDVDNGNAEVATISTSTTTHVLHPLNVIADLTETDIQRSISIVDKPEAMTRSKTSQINTVNRTVPNIASRLSSRKSSLESLAQSAILRNYRSESISNNSQTSSSIVPLTGNSHDAFQIPIIGYEIMEERARFTIYKLRINDPRTGLSWMVFRRYTDFVRLYSKLKAHYPHLDLPLPGKRWFKDNFDPIFLEDRVRGLQIFVNVVIRKLYNDGIVRDFFCLDEPPPVCDAEPESLALFGALEDTVGALKNQIRQKDETIEYLKKKVYYLEEKMKECDNCNNSKEITLSKNNDNVLTVSNMGS